MKPGDPVVIYKNGKPIRASKNLRGILDHARRVGLKKAQALETVDGERHRGGGMLIVKFGDDAISVAMFNSYDVLCDWMKSRRSWAGFRKIGSGELF